MRTGSILDVSRRFDRRFIGLNRRRGLCRLWRMGLLLLVSVFFSLPFFSFSFDLFYVEKGFIIRKCHEEQITQYHPIHSLPIQSPNIPPNQSIPTPLAYNTIIHILTPPPFSQTASNSPPTTNTFTSPTRAYTPSQAKTTPPTRPTFTNSTSLPTANA